MKTNWNPFPAGQKPVTPAELEGTELVLQDLKSGGVLRVKVARANAEQAFIEFVSMEGPFSVRVPVTELLRTNDIESH